MNLLKLLRRWASRLQRPPGVCCPFRCGGESQLQHTYLRHGHVGWYYRCLKCDAMGPTASTKRRALRRWMRARR